MSLQRRLTLFFVLIVILPLVAAGFIVQGVIGSEIARRAEISLRPALDTTVALYNRQIAEMGPQVRGALAGDSQFGTLLQERRTPLIDEYLHSLLDRTPDLDFVIALDRSGSPAGSATRPGTFVQGYEPPTPEEIAASPGTLAGSFARTPQVPVALRGGGLAGYVVAGFWLDDGLLLATPDGEVDLSIVSGSKVIASTADLQGAPRIEPVFGEAFEAEIGPSSTAYAAPLGDGVAVVASTASGPVSRLSRDVLVSMLALLLLALLVTVGLAYRLARLITQPLGELARGARMIATGRYGHQIPIESRDEVGELATAFNEMSARLGHTITALSSSREQMKRAVRRVGETLRSTHDMRQMLESILNTAVDAVDADAGVLWQLTPTRDGLYAAMTNGVSASELGKVPVTKGMVGFVAERGSAIVLPGKGAPERCKEEPGYPVAIAVPLYSQSRLTGVISLYRRHASRPFGEEDLDTVTFLAEQGAVAIENVLLHEEAQRLSITDGLTGVWNRRYFQMQFKQVLATATRFHRPFSVLMMDLDRFKEVNDTHGHQRGDEILIEFAKRVTALLREVDTFARYGGEEFICLLSETDVQGAMTTASKIHDAIRGEPFGTMGDELLTLTVSIGVASYPEHGDSYRALVEAADRALYKAKQTGRDKVVVAEARLKLA